MAIEGQEGASSVLVLEDREGGVLRRIVAEAADLDIDHLIGVAAGQPVESWLEAIEARELAGVPVRILAATSRPETTRRPEDSSAIDVRYVGDTSLGDLGIAAIDSISGIGGTRPGVVVDSVGALSADPGKRFKFLSLLGRRVAVDDGAFLALEGTQELPEHERNTLSTVFEVTRDTV